MITDIACGEADLDTLKTGASLIPAAKITKVPKVVKAIGNVGKTGFKKGKQGDKTVWKRFTSENSSKFGSEKQKPKSKEAQKRSSKHNHRLPQIEVKFKRNPKHNSKEFNRQLKDQEKGMNELTVDEFLKNRDRYLREGRSEEGKKMQKDVRNNELDNKIDELQSKGMSYNQARKQAKEWIKTKNALHNPDEVAGGNPVHVDSIGDAKVNQSIGGQWKSRIGQIDKQIRKLEKNMTEEEKKTTYLNIKLSKMIKE